MTNKKSTKRALLLSALSLLMCVSMLVGSTFAWFTDSVTSGSNIIKSGNLDIELEYWNGTEWKDVKGASDILTNNLWEPGVTEVAYLRVANAGSLAFKYQLGINILKEVEGTNQDGEKFRLSDYIMFGVVEGVNGETAAYSEDDTGRAKAIAEVADAKKIYEGYTKASTMNANDKLYLALVVYMPTTVDNKANHNGTDIPQIDLGINVFATQYTYENDSFNNQYDDNAAFSVWNGVVPTEMPESLVVDGATQTVYVKDAAAFAYLSTLSAKWADLYTDGNGRTYTNYANGSGANYYYSGQWTVSLEADIDLNNYAITPVNIVFGEGTGATAFDGNNHIIRNVNTTTGLFADGTRAIYANLVLENVKATKGALTGVSNSSITDVTVKNATISGADYVGGLVGRAFSSVTRCKVIDSSVIATGKEAGGLIGYAEANSNGSTITNNVVKNVSVYAGNRAAGLVAQPNAKVKVYNNTVDSVTVGAADTSAYQPGAVVSNAIVPENVYDNTVKNTNIYNAVSTAAELKEAFAKGGNILLTDDVEFEKITAIEPGAEVYLNLNGKTITVDENTTSNTLIYVKEGAKLTIDGNGTIDLGGVSTMAIFAPYGELVIENGTFIRDKVETVTDNTTGLFMGAKVTASNVTINGGYFDPGYYNTNADNIEGILAGTVEFTETADDVAKHGNSKDANLVRVAIKENVSVILNHSGYGSFKVYGGTFVGANPAWGDEGCMLPTTPNYLRPWSYYQGALLDGQVYNENGVVLPDGYTITRSVNTDGVPVYTVTYSK